MTIPIRSYSPAPPNPRQLRAIIAVLACPESGRRAPPISAPIPSHDVRTRSTVGAGLAQPALRSCSGRSSDRPPNHLLRATCRGTINRPLFACVALAFMPALLPPFRPHALHSLVPHPLPYCYLTH